jgi:hypothetical protein
MYWRSRCSPPDPTPEESMPFARAALVPAALGILLFAGCAAQPLAAEESARATVTPESTAEAVVEQSPTEACDLLAEGAQELASLGDFQEAYAAGSADPEGALQTLRSADAAFAAAVDEVTHPEVRVVGDGARQAFGAFVTYIQGVHDDPANADLSAMGPLVDDFMTSFTDIAEVCA